jgi:MFS family permease
VAFVANGLGGPSFLARLPERQSDLGLSDATLGLTLVGMALGAMAASPVAGGLVGRWGSRPVLLVAAGGLGASLWTVGAAPNAPTLFAALTVVGATDAAMDISMNASGAAYEGRSGRSVMHALHGSWSVGALAAAGIAAACAATGVPLTMHLALAGAAIAGSVLVTRRGLVGGDARRPVPVGEGAGEAGRSGVAASRRAIRPILVLAAATVGGAIIEGAPSDWSAIQLERTGVGAGVAALGYAAFMAGMVAGRFTGDRLTDRIGRESPRRLRDRADARRPGRRRLLPPGVLGCGTDGWRVPRDGRGHRVARGPAGLHGRARARGRGGQPGGTALGVRPGGGGGAGPGRRGPPHHPGPLFADDGHPAARRCPGAVTCQARLAMPPSTGMTAPVR